MHYKSRIVDATLRRSSTMQLSTLEGVSKVKILASLGEIVRPAKARIFWHLVLLLVLAWLVWTYIRPHYRLQPSYLATTAIIQVVAILLIFYGARWFGDARWHLRNGAQEGRDSELGQAIGSVCLVVIGLAAGATTLFALSNPYTLSLPGMVWRVQASNVAEFVACGRVTLAGLFWLAATFGSWLTARYGTLVLPGSRQSKTSRDQSGQLSLRPVEQEHFQ